MIQITLRIIQSFSISHPVQLLDNRPIKCFLISIWRRWNQGRDRALTDQIMKRFWISNRNTAYREATRRVILRVPWAMARTSFIKSQTNLAAMPSLVGCPGVLERYMKWQMCQVSEHTKPITQWFKVRHLRSSFHNPKEIICRLLQRMREWDQGHIWILIIQRAQKVWGPEAVWLALRESLMTLICQWLQGLTHTGQTILQFDLNPFNIALIRLINGKVVMKFYI